MGGGKFSSSYGPPAYRNCVLSSTGFCGEKICVSVPPEDMLAPQDVKATVVNFCLGETAWKEDNLGVVRKPHPS